MSRLHEPLMDHIHSELCQEINAMIICIKLHHTVDMSEETAEQHAKILDARKRHPDPTWEEIVDLLTKTRDEMIRCTRPFKRH